MSSNVQENFLCLQGHFDKNKSKEPRVIYFQAASGDLSPASTLCPECLELL